MNEEPKIPTQEEFAAMRVALEAREAAKSSLSKNKKVDLGVAEKTQPEPEVDWNKSAIVDAESGDWRPGEVDMDKSSVITAEAGGEIDQEQKIAPEQPGASEKSPIELTEVVEGPEKESKKGEIEATLAKAREEYVAAEQAKIKAEKEGEKLGVVRAKLGDIYHRYFAGHKEEEYKRSKEEKIGGAQAEAAEAEEKFLKARENLKTSIKAYRDEEVSKIGEKTAEFKAAGKTDEEIKSEMEKYAKDILLATTLREAAKINGLKTDKQIELMGKSRRFINERAEEFAEWYKKLPWQAKLGTSLGLAGIAIGGAVIGSAAILTATFAGQVALRTLGGAMTTAGIEGFMRKQQEKGAEKELTKEFDGKFLEALKNQGDELDDRLFAIVKGQQGAKNKRMVVAGLVGGIVGTGILATAVREAFGWTGGGGKPGIKTGGVAPGVEKPSGVGEVDVSGPKGAGAVGVEGAAVEAGGFAKGAQEIISLPIGDRGPEGAIIDYF
ncbi:hypothetical protein KKF25_02930, partial [Patescibacteria group bacterium]|nr:hypothetical protein [Patescibacteria group bacterium]